MANQFTKGTRTQHDESTKDKIRAELLSQRLFKFAKAKGEKAKTNDMSQAQVAAARVLIERGKPALQSIEQKTINPLDELTDEELFEQAKALILSNPALLGRIRSWLQLVDAPALGANADTNTAQEAAK